MDVFISYRFLKPKKIPQLGKAFVYVQNKYIVPQANTSEHFGFFTTICFPTILHLFANLTLFAKRFTNPIANGGYNKLNVLYTVPTFPNQMRAFFKGNFDCNDYGLKSCWDFFCLTLYNSFFVLCVSF